jgi:putative toxin-antitoxin system antitoxin component (TIGR02293 family)
MGISTAKPKLKRDAGRTMIQRKRPRAASVNFSGAGVVNFFVRGLAAAFKPVNFTPARLVAALQNGLPFRELEDLRTHLGLPAEKLASMLGISKATFHRKRGDASKLTPAVSDRVVRYASLLGQAFKVFEDFESAKQWLNAPQFGLGGAAPLEYAKTEIGARDVENLLGRIEYGVYS